MKSKSRASPEPLHRQRTLIVKQTIDAAPGASERAPLQASRLDAFKSKTKTTAKRVLRFTLQLGLLVAVYAAGCGIASILPLSLPGNILGMVLLLALLGTGALKPRHVDHACDYLLDNMSLFFIPAGVAIMGCVSLLADNAAKFAFVCVITTVLVFLATSYTVILVSRLLARRTARRASDGGEVR